MFMRCMYNHHRIIFLISKIICHLLVKAGGIFYEKQHFLALFGYMLQKVTYVIQNAKSVLWK